MDFIWFLVVGLIAGILAKLLMPGEKHEPRGCLLTMALGMVGALITGFIVKTLLRAQTSDNFVGSIVGATIGAMLLIWLMRKFIK